MNKRTIVASLNKIANELDNSGLYAEANEITNVMMRLSQLESIFLGGLGGQKGAEFMKGKNFPYNPSGGPSFPKNPYAKDSGFDKEPVRRDLEIPYNPSGGPSFPKNPYAKDPGFDKEPEKRNIEIPFNPSGGMIYPPRGGGKKTTPSIPSESEEKPGADRPIFERYPPISIDKKPLKPNKPTSPSKPSESLGNVDGLDRWVNKAENIYANWVDKGADPNSNSFGMIKDVVDYMQKVKSNLPMSLQSQADAKINKVQSMLGDIFDGIPDPSKTIAVAPYGMVSGYKSKGVNPFQQGRRLQDKKLDYQAKQESKSYK
jgi:hypothetical protein